jgi:Cu(I)/Ag(I) efflux system periplasmic protein CusF
MKGVFKKLATACLTLTITTPAFAEWASAEIRRLDPANQRMTIKHGEIKNLDMPPMTMVFQVQDPALFQGLEVGQVIQFKAEMSGTRYVVTAIQNSKNSQ